MEQMIETSARAALTADTNGAKPRATVRGGAAGSPARQALGWPSLWT